MLNVQDQCGNEVELKGPPGRIVSLVPSQTELLWDLGLEDEVVGITRYCVHPKHWKTEKKVVGGTKDFNIRLIEELKPDLIIGNKEENYREGIELLQQRFSVWMSDIASFEDALTMVSSVGLITHRSYKSDTLVTEITHAFSGVRKVSASTALYLIWRKPWMAAAEGTFIHDMLQRMGFANSLSKRSRYPQLTSEEIRELNPDFIFLSSEPFPFSEKHISELTTLSPSSKIMLVDGEMFSWYGSRLKYAPAYFNSLPLPWM